MIVEGKRFALYPLRNNYRKLFYDVGVCSVVGFQDDLDLCERYLLG